MVEIYSFYLSVVLMVVNHTNLDFFGGVGVAFSCRKRVLDFFFPQPTQLAPLVQEKFSYNYYYFVGLFKIFFF